MLMNNLAHQNSSSSATAIPPEFLAWVMTPYFDDTTYLKSAEVFYDVEKSEFPVNLQGVGQFSIPSSCYIESTGHFNAVEFVMCFNQLGYVTLARALDRELIPGLRHWGQHRFNDSQLPDILIASISSDFRKAIDAKRFTGRVRWQEAEYKRRHMFMKWEIEFSDENGGLARGEALTCVRNALAASETER